MYRIGVLGDPKLVCHPVLILLSDMVWNGPLYFAFLTCKLWLVFTLCVYITAQAILSMWGKNQDGFETGNRAREMQFACRVFVYILCMGQLAIYHARSMIEAYKANEVVRCYGFALPTYLKAVQEWISLLQCVALICMLCTCPKLYCMVHWHEPEDKYLGSGILSDWCPEAEKTRITYGILSVITMLIFFVRMTEFVVLNNTLAAYSIMVSSCVREVSLFLLALGFTIFAFSASTLSLFEYNDNFKDIPAAALSYLDMAFAIFDSNSYDSLHGTVMIFILVILFQVSIYVFLVNLMIAQLCSTHNAMYDDIIGHARLKRIQTIYATYPYVPVPTWTKWIGSLCLDQKLEFNIGDVGLAGGIQVYEPANANLTTVDTIKRFGGSTSPTAMWPEEPEAETEGQALQRLEKVVVKMSQTLDRLVRKTKGGGGSSSMGVSGAGDGSSSSGHSGHDRASDL